jgi:hypothetical protein
MNIIEEQTMNDETNPRISGNMDAGPSAPSAKKVYSKPTLVVLSQSLATSGNKRVPSTLERSGTQTISQGPS